MAINKICGNEIEYASTCAILGSDTKADAIVKAVDNDNRLRIATHPRASSTFTRNGSRLYKDIGGHPEFAGPECDTARDVALWERANEQILTNATAIANLWEIKRLETSRIGQPKGPPIRLFRNNRTMLGPEGGASSATWGKHENFLIPRRFELSKLVEGLASFIATRPIVCGAGAVTDDGKFQISQRADFMFETSGGNSTKSRSMIHLRDEPHADQKLYRRVAVICGDTNRSEVATLVGVGSLTLVTAMTEDGFRPPAHLQLADPVEAIKKVSQDLTLKSLLKTESGKTITAIDVQKEYLAAAEEYVAKGGAGAVGGDVAAKEVLGLWKMLLHGVESDWSSVAPYVDWIAKYALVEHFEEKRRGSYQDRSEFVRHLHSIDLSFSECSPKSLSVGRIAPYFTDDEVSYAMLNPSPNPRAIARTNTALRLSEEHEGMISIDWSKITITFYNKVYDLARFPDPIDGRANELAPPGKNLQIERTIDF